MYVQLTMISNVLIVHDVYTTYYDIRVLGLPWIVPRTNRVQKFEMKINYFAREVLSRAPLLWYQMYLLSTIYTTYYDTKYTSCLQCIWYQMCLLSTMYIQHTILSITFIQYLPCTICLIIRLYNYKYQWSIFSVIINFINIYWYSVYIVYYTIDYLI